MSLVSRYTIHAESLHRTRNIVLEESYFKTIKLTSNINKSIPDQIHNEKQKISHRQK